MAGLKADNKPFISGFDLIGAPVFTEDFVVGGTCTENLHGMCESLYRPDMVRLSLDHEKMYQYGSAYRPGSFSLISNACLQVGRRVWVKDEVVWNFGVRTPHRCRWCLAHAV